MENTVENGAMFWLRCNKCYRLVKKSTRKFSLTQCQHLFCSECIVGVEKKCPECEALAVKTVPLAKPLQQPLLHYFGNVGILLQRAYEAAHFQRIQRDIVLRRFSEIVYIKWAEFALGVCTSCSRVRCCYAAEGFTAFGWWLERIKQKARKCGLFDGLLGHRWNRTTYSDVNR